MIKNSRYGFLSGFATAVNSFLATLGLCTLFWMGWPLATEPLFFIVIGILAKIMAERLFWKKIFPIEIGSMGHLKNWRSSMWDSLFSQVPATKAMFDMLIDLAADVILVYMALKAEIAPLLVMTVLLGSQAMVAMIHGLIADRINNKRMHQMFSLCISIFAVVACMGVKEETPGFYAKFFKVDHLALSAQILIFLCAKCILTGTTVVSRAIMAEYIQAGSEKHFQKG